MDRSLAHRYARGGVRRRDLRTSLKVEKPAEDRKLLVPDDEFPIRAAAKSTIGRLGSRRAVMLDPHRCSAPAPIIVSIRVPSSFIGQ